MVKKKKTQLKAVARGFTTTSVPKKAVPVEEDAETSTSVTGSLEDDIPKADNVPTLSVTPAQAQMDKFDPSKVEEQSLQDLVDRLQLTTEKDIVRTVKVYSVIFA